MNFAINQKILLSFASIALAAAFIIGATLAFFSDQESSQNNALVAGAIDLKIDNESYLNGVLQDGTNGTADTTWELDDLNDQLFFNFEDIKPGDIGEDTISLHSQNDCWLCAEITLTANNDNTCTEPEKLDDPTCSEPNGNQFDGELAQNINFIFWADDGDNVLEDNEYPAKVIEQGTAQDILDDNQITLADSLVNNLGGNPGDPMPGGNDENDQPIVNYIGKAWCFGTLTPDPQPAGDGDPTVESGINCDGTQLDNATQTDKLLADIKFTAIQARNNPDFVCQPGATPTPTPTPSPEPCEKKPDVMLALDRSGSINSSELSQLKSAANDFIDSLSPAADEAHVGMVSFSTSSTLNTHLTDDGTSVQAAINALTSGGLTNLQSAINNASGELANPGDGHDRADGDSPDFMVIITDGNPNEPGSDANARAVAAAAADAARAAGTTVYVLGVGNDVDDTYLENEIADDAAHYFSVANFGDLSTILNEIANCPQQ